MKDEQVDLLDAELGCALLEPVQRLVVAVVGDPDLGLQEYLGAVEARGAHRVADLALVAVGGGRVDQAVAVAQRGLDGGGGLLGRALEDAEAESRHLDAVVQLQGRDCCRGHRCGPLVAVVAGPSRTSSDAPLTLPRSRRLWYSTLMPAGDATSSRPRPGTRRCEGRPARAWASLGGCSGTRRCR